MLSIVIPALNSAPTISLTLSSIFANDFSREMFEVLVVDNGSSDSTVKIAQRYPVKVLSCLQRGIGPARNMGIEVATGDIVCSTDSDCVVEKDWLQKISDFFKQNCDADGVGGPVFSYEHALSKTQRLTGQIFVEDQGYPDRIMKVRFGSMRGMIFGSNCAYKKGVVSLAGGYNLGGSNLELVWRLASMNKNLFFNPELKVKHIFPFDIKSVFKEQFRWGMQSTQMKRRHGVFKGLKEFALISYFPVRRLLYPDSPKNLEKKLLHFTQLASYSLGRVYGLRS